MADDIVLYDVADRVALITWNRPDRMNAWTSALETAYFDALQRAADDPDVNVIVVTGAGRGFCPGADMDMLQGLGGSDGDDDGGGESLTSAHRRPVTFPLGIPKPIIGAINGACAGVGLVQALMFDVRFAAAGAKWTTAFSRRGLIAEYGSAWLLPRLAGTSVAMDLLLSARVFLSEEAMELGLANRVLPGPELLDETLAYAKDIAASCSPASLAVMKKQIYGAWTQTLEEAGAESFKRMIHSLGGPDFVEGVQSYVQRRPASFKPLGQGTLAAD
jgi:enoyl-CoA hydratase/carnithine racemase